MKEVITESIDALAVLSACVVICLTVYKTTKLILETPPPIETVYLDDDDLCTDDWCECACH